MLKIVRSTRMRLINCNNVLVILVWYFRKLLTDLQSYGMISILSLLFYLIVYIFSDISRCFIDGISDALKIERWLPSSFYINEHEFYKSAFFL